MTTDDSGAASNPGRGPLPDDVIDERFAAIIAGYDQPGQWADESAPGRTDAPAAREDDASGTDPAEGTSLVGGQDGSSAESRPTAEPPATGGPTILSIPVWRGTTGPSLLDETREDEDDAFVPAPVDLPPSEDLHYWGAVIGLVLGPILVLYVAIAQPFYATWWLLAGLALSVGGFALLVLRSPNKGDHEDDDSGARV
jgi:hypothetical protein